MTKSHTMLIHIGDLIKDTYQLDEAQFGAYMRLLLAHMTIGEEGLPEDDKTLMRLAGCTQKVWNRIKPTVKAFFQWNDGVGVHPRVLKELDKSATRRANVMKRWNTDDTKNDTKPDTNLIPPVSVGHSKKVNTSVREKSHPMQGETKTDVSQIGYRTETDNRKDPPRQSGSSGMTCTFAEYIRAHDLNGIPDEWLPLGRVALKQAGNDPQQIAWQTERFEKFYLQHHEGKFVRKAEWSGVYLGWLRSSKPPRRS